MRTDLIVLLQPLSGKSFRLRQCQKTPVVQDSRSEDAVEALEKMDIARRILDQYSGCQFHGQRAISSPGGPQTHYHCHCAGNPLLSKRGATPPAS